MTPNWVDLLVNPADLRRLYETPPRLNSVTVRSVHLNHFGPALTLRVDLAEFPPHAPAEWRGAGFDRVQCHLQFIAVDHLEMQGWNPPANADIQIDECGGRRIRVTADSSSFRLSFEAAETVVMGHLSAFAVGADGADDGPRAFVGRLDARKFDRLPELDEKTFYERI